MSDRFVTFKEGKRLVYASQDSHGQLPRNSVVIPEKIYNISYSNGSPYAHAKLSDVSDNGRAVTPRYRYEFSRFKYPDEIKAFFDLYTNDGKTFILPPHKRPVTIKEVSLEDVPKDKIICVKPRFTNNF